MLLLVALVVTAVAGYSYFTHTEDPKPRDFPAKPLGSFKAFERIVIIGLPMSGKTTLAAKLTKDCPRVVYFDPQRDYAKMTGAEEISSEALIASPSILNRGRFKVSIVPTGEPEDEVEDITRIVRAAGDLVFVYDEVGDYNQGNAGDTLKRMARTGRHDGIVSVYVSQVAVDIPKTVRRLATRVYSFRQVHPHDIKALEEVYGEDFAQRVKHAGEHEVSEWRLLIPGAIHENMKASNE